MEQKNYVQVGVRTIRNGDYKFAVPLYMRILDDKAYHVQRDKCLSGISQMVIEKHRERLQSTIMEGSANGR